MKIKKYITVITTLIFTIGMILLFPYLTISPGKLAQGHQEIKNDCFKCHAMFNGVKSSKCNSCHKLFENNNLFSDKESAEFKNSKSVAFHQNLEIPDCTGCHSGHKDGSFISSKERFSHKFIKEQIRENCASCHKEQKPFDKIHEQVTGNCV